MRKVERFPERSLYKLLLLVLKVIPMLLALSAMMGMLLDFFGKDSSIFSFIGGMSLLPLLFLYLASYVFRFCEYHRMFLHYVVANNILTYTDYYIWIRRKNLWNRAGIIAGSHILTSQDEGRLFLSDQRVQVTSSRILSCMKSGILQTPLPSLSVYLLIPNDQHTYPATLQRLWLK